MQCTTLFTLVTVDTCRVLCTRKQPWQGESQNQGYPRLSSTRGRNLRLPLFSTPGNAGRTGDCRVLCADRQPWRSEQ